MRIQFTKKQYFQLMRVVYLGNWFVNAIRLHDDRVKEIDDIEQYILSYAKQFNQFFPTKSLEEDPEIMRYINEYDDENFWEDLVYKLARRDFIQMYGQKAIEKMGVMERINKEQPFLDKYFDEIEVHGLERLMIKKDEKEFSILNKSKVN